MVPNLNLHLPIKDLSDLLGITPQAIHKYFRENHVRTEKTDSHSRIPPEEMIKFLELRQFKKPKSIISAHLVKGGVGKTTLINALASRSSLYGLKTLMIDLDQQANLSSSFNVYANPEETPTFLDVFLKHFKGTPIKISEAIVKLSSSLHLIPSNLTMTKLDHEISSKRANPQKVFRDVLLPITNDYDLIFIDCPPALNWVTSAAHCVSDLVLLPINADKFSMEGLELTFSSMVSLTKEYGAKPEVKIVLNKFDAREKLPLQLIAELHSSQYRDMLCETYISNSKQIQNSIASHESIWSTRSKSAALDNFNNLLIEILHLHSWRDKVAKSGRRSVRKDLELNA